MELHKILLIFLTLIVFSSCAVKKIENKGFSISQIEETDERNSNDGVKSDTILETRPRNVLLTKHSNHRLIPIFKVNYNKQNKHPFVGSIKHHKNYSYIGKNQGNQWNNNFMPGFAAVYGYNFVNVSHYSIIDKKGNSFFEKPVLIKTLYYPAFSKDTLNSKPIERKYYMVSAYNEDTNKDGFINVKDMRRFFYFDISGNNKELLVPENYSVMNSEYDPVNDYMYIFARLDENKNGQRDDGENIHIFWIDLNDVKNRGRQY